MIAVDALLSFLGVMGGLAITVQLFRLAYGRTLLASAPLMFLGIQLLFLIGVVQYCDWSSAYETSLLGLMTVALLCFVLGLHAANVIYRFSPRRELAAYKQQPMYDDTRFQGRRDVLTLIALVSVIVAYIFVRRVGQNPYSLAIEQFLETGTTDAGEFTDIRVSATRAKYVAAGYTVQLTAVLLPAIALLLYQRGVIGRRRRDKVGALGLLLASIYAVTASGGRHYFVHIGASFLLLFMARTSPFARSQRPNRKTIRLFASLFFVGYGLATVLQGRVAPGAGPMALTKEVVSNAYNRVAGEYSENQWRAVRLLEPETPAWGKEWRETLKNALPGPVAERTFEQRVHALVFSGNDRGNMPLAFMGSVYYNWGPGGLIVISFLVGIGLQAFTITFLIRRPKTLTWTVFVALAGIRLGFVRDPYSLLLDGGATLLMALILVRIVTKVLSSGKGYRMPELSTSPTGESADRRQTLLTT